MLLGYIGAKMELVKVKNKFDEILNFRWNIGVFSYAPDYGKLSGEIISYNFVKFVNQAYYASCKIKFCQYKQQQPKIV